MREKFGMFLILFLVNSCALWDTLFPPDLHQEKRKRFSESTGHELLKVFTKKEKLGYLFENGAFVKKVWGGKIISGPAMQSLKLTYKRENFDKIKAFLGDDLSLGPEFGNIHHIVIRLEDIYKYELIDFQPMIEYMGSEDSELLRKNFIVSMLKATRYTVEAYQKVNGEFGVEYRPYPMVKLRGSTGTSSERKEEQLSYNSFIGYKLYNGGNWIRNFDNMPKAKITLLEPSNDNVIPRIRARIKGSIMNYQLIDEKYRNILRVYLMVRDEYEDNWVLQAKARIDTYGGFEGIVKLGSFEKGNGHRFSVAAFATYFTINRKVNSIIPLLPFNKGKFIINVKRQDKF